MLEITQEALKTLLDARQGPCVSLYMPCFQAVPEREQNRIRLKNMTAQAQAQLAATTEWRQPDIEAFLEPATSLLRQGWTDAYAREGLALFLAPDFARVYSLPLVFEETVVVSQRFHVKPLVPLFTGNMSFCVLTLSQEEARIYQGTRFGLDEVDLPGFPVRLEEITAVEDEEREVQLHTSTRPSPRGNDRQAVFHGTEEETLRLSRLRRYFRLIDRRLRPQLGGTQIPLILVGVDSLFPIYREANTHPHLIDAGIAGSPERFRVEELHRRAWAILQPFVKRAQDDALDAYQQLAGTERASADLETVIDAARTGRVAQLMVARGQSRLGYVDADSGAVRMNGDTDASDLLDLAVAETLNHSGTAYLLSPEDMPGDAPLAAVFRY